VDIQGVLDPTPIALRVINQGLGFQNPQSLHQQA